MSQLIPSTTPIRTFEDREGKIMAVAIFPNRPRMVTGSDDKTLRLWDLETGVVLKKMEGHSSEVWALAVSRDGRMIASGDFDGQFIAWHGETGESLIEPTCTKSYSGNQISSVDFSPDGTVLAIISSASNAAVTFWCTKTWQMQGEPIKCRGYCVQYSPSGEFLAIATEGNIQIYNPDTREHIATLTAASCFSLAWTPDGTRLLSAGNPLQGNPTIREWDSLTWQQVGLPWELGYGSNIYAIAIHPAGTLVASASRDYTVRLWRFSDQKIIAIFNHSIYTPKCVTFSVDGRHILSGGEDKKISEWAVPKDANSKILATLTARDACVTGDLPTAEESLSQDIHTNTNDHASYAHRSFVMSRKHAWDLALEDAVKSITIRPSLTGYISKGIALCGIGHVREARAAFDVASMFTNQDSTITHFLLLIKAIALFNANQHEDAMLIVTELAAACPNADLLGCRVVETYLRIELGTKALGDARHDEATDHFTAAVNAGVPSSTPIHHFYEDLVVLFGWDLESLLLTAHQKRCRAFLSAGKSVEALEAHAYMMDAIDETAKASCLNWSNEFKEQCSALAAQNDRILAAEIPGQEQDGYDAEPNFFHGMHQHYQNSRPRPQQRHRRLKKLRLAMTRTPRSAPPPVPPTTTPPVAVATSFKTHIRHIFARPPHRATPPVVDVAFAQGLQRNAAAGAPQDVDDDLIRDEDYHGPHTPLETKSQQQQQAAVVQVDTGEHGGGWSCCCC